MYSFMLPQLTSVPEGFRAARGGTAERPGAGVDIGVLVEVLLGGEGFAAVDAAELLQFQVKAANVLVEVPVGGVNLATEREGTRVSFFLHHYYFTMSFAPVVS